MAHWNATSPPGPHETTSSSTSANPASHSSRRFAMARLGRTGVMRLGVLELVHQLRPGDRGRLIRQRRQPLSGPLRLHPQPTALLHLTIRLPWKRRITYRSATIASDASGLATGETAYESSCAPVRLPSAITRDERDLARSFASAADWARGDPAARPADAAGEALRRVLSERLPMTGQPLVRRGWASTSSRPSASASSRRRGSCRIVDGTAFPKPFPKLPNQTECKRREVALSLLIRKAGCRTRTDALLFTRQVLYQLS